MLSAIRASGVWHGTQAQSTLFAVQYCKLRSGNGVHISVFVGTGALYSRNVEFLFIGCTGTDNIPALPLKSFEWVWNMACRKDPFDLHLA
jgi:hypothetical protein